MIHTNTTYVVFIDVTRDLRKKNACKILQFLGKNQESAFEITYRWKQRCRKCFITSTWVLCLKYYLPWWRDSKINFLMSKKVCDDQKKQWFYSLSLMALLMSHYIFQNKRPDAFWGGKIPSKNSPSGNVIRFATHLALQKSQN